MALPSYQYNGEALILKSRRHGEADLILTLLTADLGKFDVLARGARKAKSRKSGHVEPFVLASFSLRRSKWLPEVVEAQIQDAFPLCRASLEKVTQASYICELIDSLNQPSDPGELSQDLFDLLHFVLHTMNQGESRSSLLLRWFELQVLTLTGFQVELQYCTECKQEAEPRACYFNLMHGGILCPDCGPSIERAERISLPEFKALRFLQRSDWGTASQYEFPEHVLKECGTLLSRFISSILERQLRTERFRRQLRE